MNNIDEYLISKRYPVPKHNEYKSSESLMKMIQGDENNKAKYESYDFADAKDKFKKGFVSIFLDDAAVVIEGMNSGEDFVNLLQGDPDDYEYLDRLEVGERYKGRGEIVIRLW